MTNPWNPIEKQNATRWKEFDKVWTEHPNEIPFDMFAKYAQEQITMSFIAGYLTADPSGAKVLEKHHDTFLHFFLNPTHVRNWLLTYASSGNANCF